MKAAELTEDQKDEGARDYWSMAVEAALYANLYFQDDLSQTAVADGKRGRIWLHRCHSLDIY